MECSQNKGDHEGDNLMNDFNLDEKYLLETDKEMKDVISLAENQDKTKNESNKSNQKPVVHLDGDTPILAYIHNLSPLKSSQRNNLYFDLTLQTSQGSYRTVCFSPEKHSKCKSKSESSSPLKLSKYQVKRNTFTNEDEIFINKRTKLDEPREDEINFDIQFPSKSSESATGLAAVNVKDVQATTNLTLVTLTGRVTFQGFEETILKNGKTLRKQEAVFTDNTASIRLVLWEQDINKVESGSFYKLSNTVVREYENEKYLTLNKKSKIESTVAKIERQDDVTGHRSLKSVECPAEGVVSLKRFLSCKKCHVKVAALANKPIIKCSECGLTQLKKKCKERFLANVLFQDGTSTTTLLLFDDKLQQLFNIYKEQNTCDSEFEGIDDDFLMEILLTVEAKVLFNNKRNVVSIEKLST
ncbi:uncharacterized protein LOC114542249 isoform X2 [Dendronephthya gigantea]|nr:uncharacterized protein LOC114542249 isoform X2 [Dendronephthya gigantea]